MNYEWKICISFDAAGEDIFFGKGSSSCLRCFPPSLGWQDCKLDIYSYVPRSTLPPEDSFVASEHVVTLKTNRMWLAGWLTTIRLVGLRARTDLSRACVLLLPSSKLSLSLFLFFFQMVILWLILGHLSNSPHVPTISTQRARLYFSFDCYYYYFCYPRTMTIEAKRCHKWCSGRSVVCMVCMYIVQNKPASGQTI